MLATVPGAITNTPAFEPILAMLRGTLVTPADLALHWSYTEEHLCNLRRANRGLPSIKLQTGGVRYRASDILKAELEGTTGPLTLDRVLQAVSACVALSEDDRLAVSAHLRAAFTPTG